MSLYRRPRSEDDPNADVEFDRLRDAMFDFCGGCGELADYCVCEPT